MVPGPPREGLALLTPASALQGLLFAIIKRTTMAIKMKWIDLVQYRFKGCLPQPGQLNAPGLIIIFDT